MCTFNICNSFSNACSVVGAVIISIGFYAVLWGKSKEESNDDFEIGRVPLLSNSKTPLLKVSDVIRVGITRNDS